MSEKHEEPVVVGSYPSEFEAMIIRNLLVEQGVPAEVVGGTVGGFRAEAPSMVQVMVPSDQLERALAILDQQQRD